MNRTVQVVVTGIAIMSLALWGAYWWMKYDDRYSSGAPTIPRSGSERVSATELASPSPNRAAAPSVTAATGAAVSPPSAAPQPNAPLTLPPEPLPSVPDVGSSKPPIPAQAEPEPPPIKPNAKGEIDLSSDPSTKAFTDFLEQGRARRLEQERQK